MEKKNTGLIVLVIVLSLMVVGLSGFVIYDKVLSDKEQKEENKDNLGESAGDENNNNLDGDANKGNISIEEIKGIFEFVYNYYVPSFVFCGKSEITNKMPENGNGLPYSVSLDFENYDEMLSYLKEYMSEEVISKKFAFASTDKKWYYEYDGKLFCENTGKGNIYAINKTDIEIKSQDENKVVCVASVELINAFDQTDNKNYEKVNITLEKNNDNWIITSYEKQ